MDISSLNVSELIAQKISEINSRLPSRNLSVSDASENFQAALSSAGLSPSDATDTEEAAASTLGTNYGAGTTLQSLAAYQSLLNQSGLSYGDSTATGLTSTLSNYAPLLNTSTFYSNGLYNNLMAQSGSLTSGKYPLVSGSYESNYVRLSQTQIKDLMPRIDAAIEASAEKYGVDPLLVRSVMRAESSFQPFALSTSGAMGLMQLMPGTAKGLGVTDPYNIEQNIRGGTAYLSYQLAAFDGDVELALAAYNAGPNAVRKYNGIPPYAQTQAYVPRVLQYYSDYQNS